MKIEIDKCLNIEIQYERAQTYGGEETTGYDTDASEAKFEQMLRAKLKESYPVASIEITIGIYRLRINYDNDHKERFLIKQIIDDVWDGFDWLVKQEI